MALVEWFTSQKPIALSIKKCKVKNPNTTPQLQKLLMQSLSSKSFIDMIFNKIQSELHQDPDCILLNSVKKKNFMLLLQPARAQGGDSVVVGLC